jgi:hypothetical protein
LLFKTIDNYAVSLYAAGLAKIFFGFLVKDFDITSWHNFPGIVMLTGAIIFQFVKIKKKNNCWFYDSLFFLSFLFVFDIRFAIYVKCNKFKK